MNTEIPLGLPKDKLREGFSSHIDPVVTDVEITLEHHKKLEKQRKMFTLAHVYGSAIPMRMEMEERFFDRKLRLPGLESSNLGYDIITGKDIDIDFEHVLNTPEFFEKQVDLHASMEKKLHIDVKMRN